MKYIHLTALLIFIACGQNKKQEPPHRAQDADENVVDAVAEEVPKKMDTRKFSDVMDGIKEKQLPLIDTTNFDRFIDEADRKAFDAQILSIEKVYPDFYAEASKYQPMDLYKVQLSSKFYTVVMTFRKGDFEMESTLVNYDLEGNMIDHQLIAYDEIAEGSSRVESKISENKILSNRIFWTEKKEIEQEEYRIKSDGKIEASNSKTLSKTLKDYTLILSVLNELGLNLLMVKTNLVASKVSPQDPNEVIIAIPEIVDEGEHYFELNSHIVIADSRSGKIKYKYFESFQTNEWVSDAVELREIKIDTAPYQVLNEKRAFGIRVYYLGLSRPNPYENETLSLFVKSGNKLQKILGNYSVMDYGGEWDTDCWGEFVRNEKILFLSKKQTMGWFDILVKNKITETKDDVDENGECISNETISTETSVLKFNGEEYKADKT
ncbi:hypothetical protein [Flagellimonas lutimaris]|uniref:hypothetical protein n=1 Tax=Flagellimonas lutimaris TaxID=475082 RepID=UPI003F5CF376